MEGLERRRQEAPGLEGRVQYLGRSKRGRKGALHPKVQPPGSSEVYPSNCDRGHAQDNDRDVGEGRVGFSAGWG